MSIGFRKIESGMKGRSSDRSPLESNAAVNTQFRDQSKTNRLRSNSRGSLIAEGLASSKWQTGPTIALRPPLPRAGNLSEGAEGYQMRAGIGGGNSLAPVLLRDRLTGFRTSNNSPT